MAAGSGSGNETRLWLDLPGSLTWPDRYPHLIFGDGDVSPRKWPSADWV